MKPEKFPEIQWITSQIDRMDECMKVYRGQHPQYNKMELPEYFYFKIYDDRCVIHWAIILKEENWTIYFINMRGRTFDKLEFGTKKQAQRALRRNKFFFSTNKKCPCEPIQPLYINIGMGKKSAPYSKGNLWKKQEKITKSPKVQEEKTLSVADVEKKSDLKKIIKKIIKFIFYTVYFLVMCYLGTRS